MKTILSSIVVMLVFASCAGDKSKPFSSDWSPVYQVESGIPASVALTVYKTTMLANGHDRVMARVAVTDSTGREIRNANTPVRIYVTGDATVEGETISLNMTDGSDKYWEASLSDGLCIFSLIAGTKPDKIKLEVKADSIWPSSHEIHTIPADFKQMKPNRTQLKSENKHIDRMLGADISFVPQNEARGSKYFVHGKETDAVTALAENGFNYVRLRIFVNPGNDKGYSPKDGYCDLEHTKLMAKRVRDAGMKLLLNFHYSDYWADPQQQNKPLEWQNISYNDLKKAVGRYTLDVLNELKAQGTSPDMVQVGNEINHGLLWPDGHISNPEQLAGLLKAGIAAVNEFDPKIPVMMHLALGGQNEEAVFWLDNMIARDVKFDIIGLSYYPRWHGTLNDLQKNLFDLASRYHKPLNIVEYSQYPQQLNEIIFSLPDDLGKGTCTWEPLWTMFDRNGEANDNLFVYNKINSVYFR